ncbi:hypothetical protein [Jiella pacifica]|uniref:Uncharacterized protein n=1 Tax=Jiella pacifica TaxID=2696469 RepID=A0A6N9SWZ8_9HYPH|nr:hypothetical protein [Jiella pacifica]NDW03603.1 hypothetical protein [Jiella pacifica]
MPRRAESPMPPAATLPCRNIGGRLAAIRAAASASLAVLVLIAATGPLAAQSVIKLGQTTAPKSDRTTGTVSCGAGRYHAALAAIRDGQYQAVKTARETAAEPDPDLPGRLIFTPIVPPKSTAGRQALMSANQLARSGNRPAWMASPDSRWVMKEVSNELGRYLGQDETEYLCGGVPDYLKTLRGYLARFGGDQKTLESLEAGQAQIASDSILATRAALRPVPLPTPAPATGVAPADPSPANGKAASTDAEAPLAGSDLRPAVGMRDAPHGAPPANAAPAGETPARSTETFPASTGGTVRTATATAEVEGDPDLPPLKAPQPVDLSTDAARLAALDGLIEAARHSGALDETVQVPAPAAVGSDAGARTADAGTSGEATKRPVLARLAALRPLVYGSNSPIADVAVRRRLIDSFSAIEILDYLHHRPAESDDSVTAAIGRTLDAISEAHAQSCNCAGN